MLGKNITLQVWKSENKNIWRVFREHHYLTKDFNKGAFVYLITLDNKVIGFNSLLNQPSGTTKFAFRTHRLVVLPDYQGLGIGTKFEEFLGDYLLSQGEKLYLSADAEKTATIQQSMHSEVDERRGIIEDYLDRLLPKDWDEKDIFERRSYLEDPLSPKGTVLRDYVCIAEIWCECLGKNKEDMDRYKTREINDILRGLEGWEQAGTTRTFRIYGKQKYYARKLDY